MEPSSEGFLVREWKRLITDGAAPPPCRKRSSSPLLFEESKKRRLDDEFSTSSRDSRWSQYRDCLTLSTLTEATDSHDNNPDTVLEGNVHVAAHQVPDLEEHIDKLAMELEEWSLVNLKEWRQKKACEDLMEVDAQSPQRPDAVNKVARQRQQAAKHKLMRALQHTEILQNETMQDT